jgi:hypothetical protein
MERIFFLWARCGWIGASKEERMKFGIIGAGRIGKIHGGNVAARSDSEVAFVADADPAAGAAWAKATGAKVAEIDAMLADRHPRRSHRARRSRQESDLLRKADSPRRRSRSRLP